MGKMDLSDFTKPNSSAPLSPTLAPVAPTTPMRIVEAEILPAENKAVARMPLALKGGNHFNSRAELLMCLTRNIPLNEYAMPEIIYRTDLLDHTHFHPDADYRSMNDELISASILINYDEGFPALTDGKPLWFQLPWESSQEYDLLRKYLDMPGMRQLSLLQGVDSETARGYYHLNYWAIRGKAIDTFNVAHATRMREQRILSHSDTQYLEAERMLTKIRNMAAEVDWEVLKAEPHRFVEVYERLVKLERVALGLSAHGNAAAGEVQKPTSVELIMRNLTQGEARRDTSAGDSTDMSRILQDLDSIDKAQELIIRVSS
jgi:hypothetical protein